MILLATVFADSVNLKCVSRSEVVILAADLLLEFADFLREKFHGTAALGADHVVMAATVVLVLVAGDAVVKGDFAGQATLGEKFQRAVDRGIADASILFLDQAVEFVGGEVVASFEKRAENCVALASLLQANILQVAMKYVLGLADHLPREGGLIIDAFLEHGVIEESEYHPAS
jgi:hypothetical protein